MTKIKPLQTTPVRVFATDTPKVRDTIAHGGHVLVWGALGWEVVHVSAMQPADLWLPLPTPPSAFKLRTSGALQPDECYDEHE